MGMLKDRVMSGMNPRGAYLAPEFGAETDDRNKFVMLTSCNYHVTPLNSVPDPCPRCMSGRVVMMCLLKKGWGGYMYKVCRQCAWCKEMYASEAQTTINMEERVPHNPEF